MFEAVNGTAEATTPNRKSRRAVKRGKPNKAKPVTASAPQPTPEQMLTQYYAQVFQQAHNTLQVLRVVNEEITANAPELLEVSEALTLVRRELVLAGLGLTRPAVAKLKQFQAFADAQKANPAEGSNSGSEVAAKTS